MKKEEQIASEKAMGVIIENYKLKQRVICAQPELAIMESDLSGFQFNHF